MVAAKTAHGSPQDAPRAPGRPLVADHAAILRLRLGFPHEVFVVLVQPLILGIAGRVPSARPRDLGTDDRVDDPLGRSVRWALRSLAVCRDRILPPNVPPERVGELAHRWTYAVLVAALLRNVQAPGCSARARQYEGVVPDLGRAWIGEDPVVSLALADVLAGRAATSNPIEAILRNAASGHYRSLDSYDTSQRQHSASVIDPTVVSVSASVQVDSPVRACAPPISPASSLDQPFSDFFDWLSDGIPGGSIEINTRAALAHHVPEGLLLVSPGIFRSFLAWQGADANSQESLKRLQRSVLKAGWHLVGADGASVLDYAWTKSGKITAKVHGIVIEQPQRLLDPLPPINSRLVRIAVAGSADP
jgi:hypothetical protein